MRTVAFNRFKMSMMAAAIVGSLGWMPAGVAQAAGTAAAAGAFTVSTAKLMYQVLPHTTLHSVPLGNAIDYLRRRLEIKLRKVGEIGNGHNQIANLVYTGYKMRVSFGLCGYSKDIAADIRHQRCRIGGL